MTLAVVFDLIALGGFSTAAAACIYVLSIRGVRVPKVPALFGLGAMVVMVLDSVGNIANGLGVWRGLHDVEEYIEVMFIPLVLYLVFSARTEAMRALETKHLETVGRLDERLAESMATLGSHRLEMLQALTATVDARDHYTAQHSMHVADYACAVAYRLGMGDELQLIEQAGLLHDLGKVAVSDRILLKPSALADDERRLMKEHPDDSARILMSVPALADAVPLVRHHHERWDGTGYPDGLAGEEIPAASRVLAVADAFDAMTTDRPYRRALDVPTAKRALLDGRGTQFDPAVVDALIELIDEGVLTVMDTPEVA